VVWHREPVIGGRSRSKSLHFAPRKERRSRLKLAVGALVVVVLLAAAGAIKAAVTAPPQLSMRQVIPAQVVLAGAAPKPAWPATGQAAVEVEGLASFGSSGSGHPTPVASLAKIMTAYVVLQDHPLTPGQAGFTLTVSAADVADYQQRQAAAQSVVAVSLGETLDELQLMQGLLVASGNNFATLLADYDAGSVPAFVAKMQAAAQRLGMAHTTYTDPSGLAATTVSTATDQLTLAAKALAVPLFAQTVGLTSVNLPVAGQLPNFFKAVGTRGYVGVKTGSDSTAGGCLVFANRQSTGGHTYTILGTVLGQDPGVQSTSALIAAALHAADVMVSSIATSVGIKTVVPAGTTVAMVSNAEGHQVPVTTDTPLTRLGYGGMTVPLSVSLDRLGRSLHQGQTVGQVTEASDPTGPAGDASAGVSADTALPQVSFGWKLRHDL
jgi:serine-type D-Ala-D-Ala carboxypeptidase (penicillin-binding protein 5/6)